MKTVAIIAVLLGLSSCSKSPGLEVNSLPFPDDNSIRVRFIDKAGNDASDKMKLIETNTFVPNHPIEFYEMVSEEYSYQCSIDGNKVPLTFELDTDDKHCHESIIELEIRKTKTERIKTFWFRLISIYPIFDDVRSDHLYEFDYRFKILTLFGEKENNLKVTKKPRISGKEYTRTFISTERKFRTIKIATYSI